MQQPALPSYTSYQIRKLIANTADDIMAAGFDKDAGWGRVNAGRAVQAALPSDKGADLFIYANGGAYCYVSLYPKASNIPVYYGKADDYGEIHIIGIEPGEYTLYAGSGDAWYTGLAVDDGIGMSVDVSLSNGENQVELIF